MSYEIENRKLRQRERKVLNRLASANHAHVEAILNQMGRRLFYLSQEDERRLLNLRWWAEKYAVDLGMVLQILITYFGQRFTRKRSNPKVGFGVRVATLTGRAAEEILKKELQERFPDDEQYAVQAQQRRWEILEERQLREMGGEDDGVRTRVKTLLDFPKPSQYVRYYRKRIREQRQVMDRELAKKGNRRFPYRENPWL